MLHQPRSLTFTVNSHAHNPSKNQATKDSGYGQLFRSCYYYLLLLLLLLLLLILLLLLLLLILLLLLLLLLLFIVSVQEQPHAMSIFSSPTSAPCWFLIRFLTFVSVSDSREFPQSLWRRPLAFQHPTRYILPPYCLNLSESILSQWKKNSHCI